MASMLPEFIPLRKLNNMKALTISCCFALLLVITACNDTATEETAAPKADSPATTTADATPKPPKKVDSATLMKNWQMYSTPSDAHKMMAAWNGTWNAEVTSWMKPGAPPTTSKGKMVNKTVFNGLYQQSSFSGDMMGMPFQGVSTTGYDNHKKVFVSSWIDNMGSGIMHMEGPWDEGSKSMTLTGKMVNPGTGEECSFRQVMKIVDDKNQVMEMYGPDEEGKEFKVMEIKYTKAN
jgi:hypothetical protein